MLCFGHRGAKGHAPENTIRSIIKGLELGVDWIEIDVFYIDGHLVVFHDETLERTTNGRGFLRDKTFSFLRSLDAGEGERIPTLQEVLDAIAGRAGLNIEIKGDNAASAVVNLIQDRARSGWGIDSFLVSSFNQREIARVRQLDQRVRIGVLLDGFPNCYPAIVDTVSAYSVHQNIEHIDELFIADAHALGLKVFAYTANHPQEIRRMSTLGVDGVFSDYPERVLSIRNSL
ncbi:MAG: glycerophosphodiester phosphodiesterase [Deltaproteobacteria bacterium]|nr:glycerophosphodiester phosphodiesterase [Deltaproteobacteria bacterium]